MDPSEKRVTIRDIARATGLHFTTVGLALRGSSLLRPETRRKVEQAARRLGYRPDPMLSALTAYRQAARPATFKAVIAWLDNWPARKAMLQNPTFRDYREGAGKRAGELGYLVEEFWLREKGMTPEKLRRIFRARNIQAILVAPQPKPGMTPGMDFQGISAVAFGYTMQPAILDVVTNHHYHSIHLLVSNLVALGYRRIGLYVSEEWNAKVDHAWKMGLAFARTQYPGVEFVTAFRVLRGNRSFEERLGPWLKASRPDVVVAHDSVLPAIGALGYRVPQDIGFASLDLDPHQPRLSGINENNILIGRTAVDLLVGMIHRGERNPPQIPRHTFIDSFWVPGETLRSHAGGADGRRGSGTKVADPAHERVDLDHQEVARQVFGSGRAVRRR